MIRISLYIYNYLTQSLLRLRWHTKAPSTSLCSNGSSKTPSFVSCLVTLEPRTTVMKAGFVSAAVWGWCVPNVPAGWDAPQAAVTIKITQLGTYMNLPFTLSVGRIGSQHACYNSLPYMDIWVLRLDMVCIYIQHPCIHIDFSFPTWTIKIACLFSYHPVQQFCTWKCTFCKRKRIYKIDTIFLYLWSITKSPWFSFNIYTYIFASITIYIYMNKWLINIYIYMYTCFYVLWYIVIYDWRFSASGLQLHPRTGQGYGRKSLTGRGLVWRSTAAGNSFLPEGQNRRNRYQKVD